MPRNLFIPLQSRSTTKCSYDDNLGSHFDIIYANTFGAERAPTKFLFYEYGLFTATNL